MKTESENNTATVSKFLEMVNFDTAQVETFLMSKSWAKSLEEAKTAVIACLQWLAAHSAINHKEAFVMIDGPVDDALHSFMLNTRLYSLFCKKYVGYFINHTPLDSHEVSSEVIQKGVSYTVNFLKKEFGKDLLFLFCSII